MLLRIYMFRLSGHNHAMAVCAIIIVFRIRWISDLWICGNLTQKPIRHAVTIIRLLLNYSNLMLGKYLTELFSGFLASLNNNPHPIKSSKLGMCRVIDPFRVLFARPVGHVAWYAESFLYNATSCRGIFCESERALKLCCFSTACWVESSLWPKCMGSRNTHR